MVPLVVTHSQMALPIEPKGDRPVAQVATQLRVEGSVKNGRVFDMGLTAFQPQNTRGHSFSHDGS